LNQIVVALLVSARSETRTNTTKNGNERNNIERMEERRDWKNKKEE